MLRSLYKFYLKTCQITVSEVHSKVTKGVSNLQCSDAEVVTIDKVMARDYIKLKLSILG